MIHVFIATPPDLIQLEQIKLGAKIWKDILLCYAALSANTKCKAGVLSVLSCVASNARLKRGPSGIVVQRQDT